MTRVTQEGKASLSQSPFSFYFSYRDKLSRATVSPWKDGLHDIIVQFDGGRAIIHGRYNPNTSHLIVVKDDIGYSPARRAAEFLNFVGGPNGLH